MTMQSEELRPEEFGQAAQAVISALQAQAGERAAAAAAAAMAEAGLFGVCVAEEAGGLGLPLEFALPVVRAAGELQLQYPLAEQIAAAKALQALPAGQELLSGAKSVCVVMRWNADDAWAGVARDGSAADYALVQSAQGFALYRVQDLQTQVDAALDPDVPQLWVAVGQTPAIAELDAAASVAFLRDMRLLWAEYLNGLSAGALERSAEYLQARVQFGRPLSAKQAVRHHLARMRLLVEASSAQVWRALRSDEFGQSRNGDSALASALVNAHFVLEKATHLYGGMGFTWELGLHRSLREVKKLDAANGAGAVLRQAGQAFVDSCEEAQ